MNDRILGGILITIYPVFILITVLAAGVISGYLFRNDRSSKRVENRVRK